MASYSTILTNIGAAKIAAALAASTSVPLAMIAVGDGSGGATVPVATQTGLVNEVYRQALNSLMQDPGYPNVMIAEIIIPASVGGWTVHEIGLIDTSGSLIAVGSFPATVKPVSADGSTQTLVIKMYFQVSNASTVSLTIDTSTVVATRSWVLSMFVPVGQVWITHLNVDPAAFFGVGTWIRYGAGRMLAFYDSAQAEFNGLDITGGSKNQTLTTPNIPSHTHSMLFNVGTAAAGDHTHSVTLHGSTNAVGDHAHGLGEGITKDSGGSGTGVAQAGSNGRAYQNAGLSTDPAGGHSHSVTTSGNTDTAGAHSHLVVITGTTDPTGSGTAFSILPPYTTLFSWLRTA